LSLTFGNDYGPDSGTSLALSAISASSNRAGRCSVAALPQSAMSQLVTGWSHWLHLASRSLVGVSFVVQGRAVESTWTTQSARPVCQSVR
jgi:hypothetical protein